MTTCIYLQVGRRAEGDAETQHVYLICSQDTHNPRRGAWPSTGEGGRGTARREEGKIKGHTPIHPYCHSSIHSYCHTLIRSISIPQVWVVLFSDIVMITQRRRGTVLMCLEPAIPLANLRVDDFNCTEGNEVISCTLPSCGPYYVDAWHQSCIWCCSNDECFPSSRY